MWAVEARKLGDQSDYWYISGLTEKEATRMHWDMADSGEWDTVRSWDRGAELEAEAKSQWHRCRQVH